MNLISQYIFRRVLKASVALTSLIIGIVWLTQSLRFIDMIVNHNISLFGYFKIIIFLLPDLMATVIPICFLISAIFVFNKLTTENELPILSAVGMSDFEIYKPVGLLGVGITVFILFINIFVVPASFKKFRDSEFNMRNEFSSSLIREGSFNFLRKATIFVQSRSSDGAMNNVFIFNNHKDKEIVVVAEKGYFHTQNKSAYLDLFKGFRLEQEQGKEPKEFEFEELNYDLSDRFQGAEERSFKPYEKPISELIFPDKNLSEVMQARMRAEGHQRLLNPTLTIIDGLLVVVFMSRNPGRRRYIRKRFYAMLALALGTHGGTFMLINSSVNSGYTLYVSYIFVVLTILGLTALLLSENIRRLLGLLK
jgi:lipopolysaccharide export system permease protein